MGRQLNFFLHPDDQKDFNDLLLTVDDICFLSYYNKTNSITIIDNVIIRDSLKEGTRVYLARKQDLKDIKFTFIENFNYWLIDNTSPVLHFDRCVFNDNEIRSGRLYFEPKYVENLQWIEKNIDFVKWSDNVIFKVRKSPKKHRYKYETSSYEYNAYLGKVAMKLIDEERGIISLPGDRITIKN